MEIESKERVKPEHWNLMVEMMNQQFNRRVSRNSGIQAEEIAGKLSKSVEHNRKFDQEIERENRKVFKGFGLSRQFNLARSRGNREH
jgi:hypothetical protein